MRPTPLEVETATFRRVMRGYDEDEVDTLLLRVAERYEAIWLANQELRHRVAELEETIRLRDEEDGLITRVLTNAQSMAAEICASARADAERTIEDARRRAEAARAEVAETLKRAARELDTAWDLTPGQRLAYRDLLLTTIARLEQDPAHEAAKMPSELNPGPEHPAITNGQPDDPQLDLDV